MEEEEEEEKGEEIKEGLFGSKRDLQFFFSYLLVSGTKQKTKAMIISSVL